jgi:hypothetical protein
MMDKLDETAGSQKTPVGNKEETARQALRLSLTAAISFVLASIGLGYAWGIHKSPKWTDRSEVAKFIAIHSTKQFDVASGRELLPGGAPIEVRLRVRELDYVYRTDTQKITPEPVPVRDLEKLKDPMQSKDNQTLIMAGGSLATAAAQLLGPNVSGSLNLLGKNKTVVAAAVGVVVVGVVVGAGAYWGFVMGYKPDPDFSTQAFQEKLNDTMLWHGLATQYRSDELRRRRPEAAPSATP